MSYKFFSGFSLEGEEELFCEYENKNDFTIAGFSYGAIKAFKEAKESSYRVDLLQLFSPAFFQTQDKKFKRMQLMFLKKDSTAYCNNFLENIAYPSSFNTNKYFKEGSYEELEELLNYEWNKDELQDLVDRGTRVEIYLGGKDKIIDSKKACEFFKEFGTVYFIKNSGHILI